MTDSQHGGNGPFPYISRGKGNFERRTALFSGKQWQEGIGRRCHPCFDGGTLHNEQETCAWVQRRARRGKRVCDRKGSKQGENVFDVRRERKLRG